VLRSTNDVEIALHDLGGDGPPLIWCHATGFHGRVYQPLAAALPHRRHWALDFRGFGDSTEPTATLTWDGFAEDVLTVVDYLGSHPIQAFGHSKGGAALLLAELQRPGTFERLYCFEPIVFPSTLTAPRAASNNPLAESARKRRPAFPSFEAAIEHYRARPRLAVLDPQCLELYVRHGFVQRDGEVWLKAAPDLEARTYEAATKHGAFDRLAEILCPVLVAASGDGEIPAKIAPLVAKALPHGRLERFDDLGHLGPIEAPGRVAAAIDDFLRQAIAENL
jgi:pimeloyl-ACP methyl ester carboxylesterase